MLSKSMQLSSMSSLLPDIEYHIAYIAYIGYHVALGAGAASIRLWNLLCYECGSSHMHALS